VAHINNKANAKRIKGIKIIAKHFKSILI